MSSLRKKIPIYYFVIDWECICFEHLSLQSFTKKSSSRWEIAQTFPTLKKTYSMKNGHLSDWRRPPYSLVFWSAIWCSKLCKRARTSDIIFSWLQLFNELKTVNSDDLLKYMTPIILNNPFITDCVVHNHIWIDVKRVFGAVGQWSTTKAAGESTVRRANKRSLSVRYLVYNEWPTTCSWRIIRNFVFLLISSHRVWHK